MQREPDKIIIDAANAGRRVDTILRQRLPSVPLGTLMKWVRRGVVRLNGRKVKPEARVVLEDALTFPRLEATPAPRQVRHGPLDILYEDEDLLILNKPAMLPCHAGTGHDKDSLIQRVVDYLGESAQRVGHKPGLAQRLDNLVSGVVPVGKHAPVLRVLAQAVERDEARKVYVTLVDGIVKADAGRIDVPLRVDDEPMGDRPRTHPDLLHGKPALTEFTVVARGRDCTLLEVQIHTGRTHQIRAHMLAMGHPILGDPRYGSKARNAKLLGTYGLKTPFLHAARLTLMHPNSGEEMVFTAPLPEALLRVGGALGVGVKGL